MTKKIFILVLILLGLLGIFARIYQFGGYPASLYWDEVAIGLDARSLIQTGKDLNSHSWLQPLFISYGDYKAPVYIWLVTLLGKLFSINETIIRLPSLLANLLTAIILFKLTKLLSSKKSLLPLFTTISFLIMPWSIHFSRIGMESSLSVLFLTLSLYLSILSAKKSKPTLLILSALVTSLGIYTYISLRIIAPILFFLVYLIYHRFFSNQKLFHLIISLTIIFLSIFTLTHSPNYKLSQAYRLSNDNLITSTTNLNTSVNLKGLTPSFLGRVFHHRYLYKAQEYVSNYFTHFSPKFLILTGDSNLRHHSGFGGQLLYFQFALLLIGVYFAAKNGLTQENLLFFSWLLLSPTVAALVNEVPHASRSIYMIVPLAWLIGLGLEKLKRSLKLIIIIGLFINLSLFCHDYFIHYPLRSALDWLLPYKQAALALKDKPEKKKIYLTSQFYKPELYIAFYQNKNLDDLADYSFFLPDTCPQDSWCISPPDWQLDKTKIIAIIPLTDQLVIKANQDD